MFYHIFFLQQSTILYFELIEIIFNRYMSQSDIHKEIDAQFIFFFFTRKLFSLPVLCPGNYMVWVSEHSNTIYGYIQLPKVSGFNLCFRKYPQHLIKIVLAINPHCQRTGPTHKFFFYITVLRDN